MSAGSRFAGMLLASAVACTRSGTAPRPMLDSSPLAQSVRIGGRVVDGETGEPIDSVQVFIHGTNCETATDSAGTYKLVCDGMGDGRLVLRRTGYAEVVILLSARALAKHDTVDVELPHPPIEVTHLEPETGILSAPTWKLQYDAKVRELLLNNLTGDPYAVLVCVPAFSPEWALIVHKPQQGWAKVDVRRADAAIWNAGRGPRTVGVSTQGSRISSETAEAVRTAWLTVLADTRPRTPHQGFAPDATSFHFLAYQRGAGILAGQTASPSAASRPYGLVELGIALRNFIISGGTAPPEEDIQRQARALDPRASR